jgi:hypothetical protein
MYEMRGKQDENQTIKCLGCQGDSKETPMSTGRRERQQAGAEEQ